MRKKKEYPLNGKNVFGLSTMGWMNTGASSFMTSMFMLYLTDYSGIGAWAAVLGTVLLLVGRIVDTVDDPLQGWIMDRTKPGKWGKYKPYIILSTVITAISLLALYCLPSALTSSPVFTTVYVLFFYLLYDIGTSFYAANPLMQTMSPDTGIRAKLTVYPRVFGMLVSIPFAFILQIVAGVNNSVGNMHDSFAIVTVAIVVPVALISLIGIGCVKEGKFGEEPDAEENKISIKDIITLFTTNKPMLISKGSTVFSGFVWTLIFATSTYYIKYRFCADLTTGAVDSGKFGLYTMIVGMLQMLPMMLGAVVGPMIVRKFGDAMKATITLNWIQAAGLLLMFVLNLMGVFAAPGMVGPLLYFVLMAVVMLVVGCGFVPGSVIGMECMDYGLWKTGKQSNAITESVGQFISKAQTALSSAIVGALLVAVGYVVDSKTDTYMGDLSALPGMLNSFMVISALLPAILTIIANIILRFYPIDNTMRAQMQKDLAERRNEQ